jgi:hypothetical protein
MEIKVRSSILIWDKDFKQKSVRRDKENKGNNSAKILILFNFNNQCL